MPTHWVVSSLATVMLLGLLVGLSVAAAGTTLTQVLALASLPDALKWILLLLAAAGLAGTWAVGLGQLTGDVGARRRERLILERSCRDLEAFAATLSHDLRAPLRGIHLHADLASQAFDRNDREAAWQQVRLVQERSEQMSQMIDELLQYSRVSSTHHEAPVPLLKIVEQAVDMAELPSNLDVRWAVADITIPGRDAARLRHVLQNVVSNAAQHHDRPDGHVVVDIRAEGDTLQITVDDDGPGIEPAQRERAFELFHTSKTEGAGGVGLAIVRRMTKEQGGDAAFVDKEGRGARLAIRWPLDDLRRVRPGQTTS